jgi:hypothetical protein
VHSSSYQGHGYLILATLGIRYYIAHSFRYACVYYIRLNIAFVTLSPRLDVCRCIEKQPVRWSKRHCFVCVGAGFRNIADKFMFGCQSGPCSVTQECWCVVQKAAFHVSQMLYYAISLKEFLAIKLRDPSNTKFKLDILVRRRPLHACK